MSKILVLAEKPSVGKELARVLGCRKSRDGSIHGDKYIVTWSLGHLITLADPEHYGKQYHTWSFETLPMLPQKMDLAVIKQTSKQFSHVKELLHSKEVSSLVIATDAGREGELVARWILAKAGFNKPIRRLWISSQTDKAIKEGFAHLKDAKEYDNLYKCAQARAEADWYVGLNATRALTCKYNAQLSAGRVQTPTLALIVNRENEIRRFIPKDYKILRADLGGFSVTYHDKKGNTAVFDAETAQALYNKTKSAKFKAVSVQKTIKRRIAPPLYDLTELQRDANKFYGYSAKQTLSFMQSLYERHKLLTYPRTDSRYLTDDIVPTLSDRLKAVSFGEYSKHVSDILKNKRQIAKACVNNSKVSDHHAIIPTEQYGGMASLSPEERRIYDLVVKRFLVSFFPAFEYESIKADFNANGEIFKANGRKIVNRGFKAVYDTDDEDETDVQELPEIKNGALYTPLRMELKPMKTLPPARYTEATLLSAMENCARFVQDDKMKAILQKSSGLGTPATRADIIEKLFDSFYVERKGKEIYPTSKGIQLIGLVPEDLKQPELTAKWEQQLEAINSGKVKKEAFIENIKNYTVSVINNIKSSNAGYHHDNMTRTPCPECGKYLLEVAGKRGKMLVCSDRECGYRQNLSFKTNVRCPNCHKTMELYGEGENRKYICACGFREKYSSFIKRMDSSNDKAGKRDVQKYMQSQKKNAANELSSFELAMQKAMENK